MKMTERDTQIDHVVRRSRLDGVGFENGILGSGFSDALENGSAGHTMARTL